MAIEERILGFDIRLDANDYVDSFWDAAKRDTYLIQPKTKWPLSVDTLVWPSVFRYSNIGDSSLDDRRLPINTQVAASGLWSDARMMRGWFTENTKVNSRGIPIAIHLFAESTLTIDQFGSDVLEMEVRPPEQTDNRLPLGFDVADSGRISGLNDCGYSPEELQRLRPQWSHRLNEFGLLANFDDALKFKEIADVRVPEHSPFYVYSLYRLP